MHAAVIPLETTDRLRVEAHLLRLSAEDRSLRFAAGVVTDDAIRRYVAAIAFNRQVVLGFVSLRGQVFGLAHGCPFMQAGRQHLEVAFSVDASWRGRGLGRRLMNAMLEHTAAAGGATVVGRCAARNRSMCRVFEHGGLALVRDQDEFEARGEIEAACGA